jgi:hypothetical protein
VQNRQLQLLDDRLGRLLQGRDLGIRFTILSIVRS